MARAFSHPNLLSGTRSGNAWAFPSGSGVGGSHNKVTGIEPYNDRPSECVVYSPASAMHTNTDYALSCFSASTANLSSTESFALSMDGGQVGYNAALKNPGPEGAWPDATSKIYSGMPDGASYRLRFDDNGSTDGERCLVRFRDIMPTDGAERHAWAPAGGDCPRYPLDIPAHADSQTFNLAATVCGDSAGWISMGLEYADAAGHANRAMERLDFPAEQARRKATIAVPSGMAATAPYVSRDESQPASRVAGIALWQGEPIADYGLALDVGTSGNIAPDVRAVYR